MTANWDNGDSRPERESVPPPAGFVRFDSDVLRIVALIGAVAVVMGAMWLIRGRSEVTSVSAPARADTARAATASEPAAAPGVVGGEPTPAGSGPSAGVVTVDVRGAVQSAGVQQLPAGSRVIDAIRAAGGVRRGHGYGAVNLAKVLVDGEQIVIGKKAANGPPGASPSTTGPADPSGAPAGGLININTAVAADLEELDGIGPVLAGNIVDWRTANGPFQSVEDLLDVSGIGEQTLAGLRDQVTVG